MPIVFISYPKNHCQGQSQEDFSCFLLGVLKKKKMKAKTDKELIGQGPNTGWEQQMSKNRGKSLRHFKELGIVHIGVT